MGEDTIQAKQVHGRQARTVPNPPSRTHLNGLASAVDSLMHNDIDPTELNRRTDRAMSVPPTLRHAISTAGTR